MAQEETKQTEEEMLEHAIDEGAEETPEAHVTAADDSDPVSAAAASEEKASGEHAADSIEDPASENPAAAVETQPEVETAGHTTAAATPAAEEPVVEVDKHWYIIHTYSGFEQKVADSLKGRADAFGFADKIGQILIPTEEVVELRAGKKVTSKRLLYPGYVMVQMEMNDQLWHEVKNTPRVTGFVGGGNSPVPLTSDEVNSILYRQATSAERPRPKMNFEKNETVRINDGPFANFSGKVDEINPERNTLRVLVTIFGRATPVELDFLQVEKI